MSDVQQPHPGRAIFGRHVYSVESDGVSICGLTGAEVQRLRPGRYARSVAFRRHAPQGGVVSKYVILDCDAELQTWCVSSLPGAYRVQAGTLPAAYRWRWLPHAAMDHQTGIHYAQEQQTISTARRRLWAIDYRTPTAPRHAGEIELPSTPVANGQVLPFALGTRRYVAATVPPTFTAIVDVTDLSALRLVSTSLPCFQALAIIDGILYGHDGRDASSWWSSWTDLGTASPKFLDRQDLESGVWYEQVPNLCAGRQGDQHVIVSGALHGEDLEALHVLTAKGGIMTARALLPLESDEGLAISPATADLDAGIVRVTGSSAWAGGDYRYWLADVDVTDPAHAAITSVEELHP